eukprot:1146369-Pelagomonas_calceolata.AAC.1
MFPTSKLVSASPRNFQAYTRSTSLGRGQKQSYWGSGGLPYAPGSPDSSPPHCLAPSRYSPRSPLRMKSILIFDEIARCGLGKVDDAHRLQSFGPKKHSEHLMNNALLRKLKTDLRIPEHSTNRTLPKYTFPRRFSDKQKLTSSRPDAILVVPMKRVPRSNSRYPLRSRGGCGGDRERSAPATATPLASKARHPSQLLPGQRNIHLVEVKHCEDTRPKNQLEASKQQHHNLCRHLSRVSAQVRAGFIYISHTLEPLYDLGLDTHIATKLALKLHARSFQYGFKLASTRRVLKKIPLSSHHQDQARAPSKLTLQLLMVTGPSVSTQLAL